MIDKHSNSLSRQGEGRGGGMHIKTFTVNMLGVNCYVAHDDTGEGVIIDCGCAAESEWRQVMQYIDSQHIAIKHLLCTHLHFDHVFGNPFVKRDLGLNPEASLLDVPLYNNMEEMLARSFGMRVSLPPMPPVEHGLREGDEVTFGNTTLQVIATPGHSQGSLCFYCQADNVLFSGDTMFCGGMGRTDLEGGSTAAIMQSLRRLATLPPETTVLCGHGPSTTIEMESTY